MSTVVILSVIFVVGVVADQLLKVWAVSALADGTVIELIPNLFMLTYVENRGGVFGLLQGASWVFLAATVVLGAVLVWLMIKTPYFTDFLSRLCLTLIVSGGIGNAIDRVFRGFVVDYMAFEFSFFPYVFNLADVFVVCATFTLMGLFLFSKQKDALFKQQKNNGGEAK
ncbi:MAG: signal peptidase II [Clostridia bacterium]|nr:signal peptidase II [Clostridia bacterium]